MVFDQVLQFLGLYFRDPIRQFCQFWFDLGRIFIVSPRCKFDDRGVSFDGMFNAFGLLVNLEHHGFCLIAFAYFDGNSFRLLRFSYYFTCVDVFFILLCLLRLLCPGLFPPLGCRQRRD